MKVLFLILNIFYFMSMGIFACMYVHAPLVNLVSVEVRRGHRISWNLAFETVMSHHVDVES